MGKGFSCISEMPTLQRLDYDLSVIDFETLPIIWLIGPPGAGRNIQAQYLAENLLLENIRVADLLNEESKGDTERANVVKEALSNHFKKIPDTLVIDLLKEAILKVNKNAKGILINDFPKNSKQARLFVKEIGDVDLIIYLSADSPTLVRRIQQKNDNKLVDEAIRRNIQNYIKRAKECVNKFGDKLEKIYTNDPPESVYNKIEEIVNNRLGIKSKITAESDYTQSHEIE